MRTAPIELRTSEPLDGSRERGAPAARGSGFHLYGWSSFPSGRLASTED